MNARMRLLSCAVIALAAVATAPARADEPQHHMPPPRVAPHPPVHPHAAHPGVPVHPHVQGNFVRPGFGQPPGIHPEGFTRGAPAHPGVSGNFVRPGFGQPPGIHPFVPPTWRGRADFRGRDIRTLRPDQQALWRSGQWHRARHRGRFGWWWVVGGLWYFYPEPVYPYPDYASTDVDVEEAPPVAAAPVGPPAQYWYYCNDPPGYYPYVPYCATPWQPVPAAPAQ
jgi:hypothetical protein